MVQRYQRTVRRLVVVNEKTFAIEEKLSYLLPSRVDSDTAEFVTAPGPGRDQRSSSSMVFASIGSNSRSAVRGPGGKLAISAW